MIATMYMDLIQNAGTKFTGYVKQETVKSDCVPLENENFSVYKSFGDLKAQSWTTFPIELWNVYQWTWEQYAKNK